MKTVLQTYLAEYKKNRIYIWLIFLAMAVCYSLYYFLSSDILEKLADENNFYELGTAGCFLIAAVIIFIKYVKTKNIFFLLLGLVFFLGAGEELSWGQHLLHFSTPGEIKKTNVQGEFNIHNIEIFNTANFDGTSKSGWHRLLEINFLFRLFCLCYGILVPILHKHVDFFRHFFDKIRLPIMPLTIGIFFAINFITFRLVLQSLPPGMNADYYSSCSELFELIAALVLLMATFTFTTQKTPEKKTSRKDIGSAVPV